MAKTQTQTAPTKEFTQIEVVQNQLTEVRKKMQQAKLDHEANLKKAKELRDLLTKVEKTVMVSSYEILANDEAALMSRLNRLLADEKYEDAQRHVAFGAR